MTKIYKLWYNKSMDRERKLKKILEEKQAMKIDGVLVDLATASTILRVASELKEDTKKRLFRYPVKSMAAVIWQMMVTG